jgi:hypothetical protein
MQKALGKYMWSDPQSQGKIKGYAIEKGELRRAATAGENPPLLRQKGPSGVLFREEVVGEKTKTDLCQGERYCCGSVVNTYL